MKNAKVVNVEKSKTKKGISRIIKVAMMAIGILLVLTGCSLKKSNNSSQPSNEPTITTPATPEYDVNEYDNVNDINKERARVDKIIKELKSRGFTPADFKIDGLDENNLPEFIQWILRVNNGGVIDISNTSYNAEIRGVHRAFEGLLVSTLAGPANDYHNGNWKGNYRFFPISLFYVDGTDNETVKNMDLLVEQTLKSSEEGAFEKAGYILGEVTENYDTKGYSGNNSAGGKSSLLHMKSGLHRSSMIIYYKMGLTFVGTMSGKITYTYPQDICDGKTVNANDVLIVIVEDCYSEGDSTYNTSIVEGTVELKSMAEDHPEVSPFRRKLN